MDARTSGTFLVRSWSSLSSTARRIPVGVETMAQFDRTFFSRKRYYLPPVLLGSSLVILGFAMACSSCCECVMETCYYGILIQAIGIFLLVFMVLFRLPRYYIEWREKQYQEGTEKRKQYLRDLVNLSSSGDSCKPYRDDADAGSYIRFLPDIETSNMWRVTGRPRYITGICNNALSASGDLTDSEHQERSMDTVESDALDVSQVPTPLEQTEYSYCTETDEVLNDPDSSLSTDYEHNMSSNFCEMRLLRTQCFSEEQRQYIRLLIDNSR